MMLSRFADDHCMYSYVNIGIVGMAILNLIVLGVIEDPPCFQLIFYENLRKSESDCKCIDVSSNSCHKVNNCNTIIWSVDNYDDRYCFDIKYLFIVSAFKIS